MLNLTEAARTHLVGILVNQDYPNTVAVRLTYRVLGVSIGLDNRKLSDLTFEHRDRVVLLLDQNTAEHLTGETVDVERLPDGDRLFLVKNNQKLA